MIKKLKPNGKYKSGKFKPKNKDKYYGNYPIIFRSSYEQKFCIFLDTHPSVIKWTSEPDFPPFPIPYYDIDGKKKRYFPDFIMHYSTKHGVKTYVIEVKSESGLNPPKKPVNKKGKHKKTLIKEQLNYNRFLDVYRKNILKKKAAEQFCKKNGYSYKLITEKWLFGNKK